MEDREYIFKQGSYIYIEGDEDNSEVFIIKSGSIELIGSDEQPDFKNIYNQGDIFGFVSALSDHPRMYSARARIDSTVVTLPRDKFLLLLQSNSDLSIKIINYFAEFLRSYDEKIFADQGNEDLIPVETRLFKTGKFYFDTDSLETAYYIFLKMIQLYPDSDHKNEAREMIHSIENTGQRSISEPMKMGIYYTYADQQIIFCEDEPGDELFIIKSGKVKIVKYNNDTEIMLSVLHEGDIFGELAIVSDKPRNATAISFGQTELLPINKDSLLKLIKKSPQILKRIFTAISQRMWFTHIRLNSRLYKQPITRLYTFLENKLLEDNVSLKSKESYIFSFGIDELLKMTGLNQETIKNAMDEFLKDSNLLFNFGQITVQNSSMLSAKARFYRSRDHIPIDEFVEIIPEIQVSDEQVPPLNHECEKSEVLSELDKFMEPTDD